MITYITTITRYYLSIYIYIGIANPNDDEEIINRILKQNKFLDDEEQEHSAAIGAMAQQKLDEDAALTGSGSGSGQKQKRLSFREKEMLKMETKKAEYARQQRAAALYRLGPSCEDRICYSCKLVVEEFGLAVIKAVRDPKYK